MKFSEMPYTRVDFPAVIAQAQEARKNGDQILVARMNKNKKFQKEQLTKEGYTDFVEFYKNPIEKQ